MRGVFPAHGQWNFDDDALEEARAERQAVAFNRNQIECKEPQRIGQLPEVLRSEVGGHHDDGVAEVRAPAAAVGQPAFIKCPKKHIEQRGTRSSDPAIIAESSNDGPATSPRRSYAA